MPREKVIVFCGLIRAMSLALLSLLKLGCERNSAILSKAVYFDSVPFDVSCSPSNSPSDEIVRPRAQCAADRAWVLETKTKPKFCSLRLPSKVC